MKPTIAFYAADSRMSDDDIRQIVTTGLKLMMAGGDAMISLDGFNDDPRELWDIPAAVNLAKKLVSMGVCSSLTLSSYLDPRWAGEGDNSGKPFGAFELWLLAKEEWGKDKGGIENTRLQGLLQKFKVDLAASNEVASSTLEGRVSDGQHKGGSICST